MQIPIIEVRARGGLFFLIAFCLLNIIGLTLLLSTILFVFGIHVTWLHLPVSVCIAIVLNYYASRAYALEKDSYFLKSILISIGVLVISVVLANAIYDTSWDGQFYHQEAVYQLKNGWNPFHQPLPDSVNRAIWINHYPKGAEIPQAAIYAITNKIETGKATNFILFAAAFFLILSFLLSHHRFSIKKSVFISSLITLNPIIINQWFTYYVDGQMACLLVCLVIAFISLTEFFNKYYFILLVSVLICALNIKFTAIAYVGIFTLSFFIYLLWNKKYQLFRKLLFPLAFTIAIGVFLVGYNPYVTNTIKYEHPFHPLMGKQKVNIMKGNFPIGFAEKNRFEKFFVSFFSHTDNAGSWEGTVRTPRLKLPFTLSGLDINFAWVEDARIAGFGPFFSGIAISSVLLLLLLFRFKNKSESKNILFLIGSLFASIIIMPEAWWARYVPQFWFIPLIILIWSENVRSKWINFLRVFLYVFIILNIGCSLLSIPHRLFMSQHADHQVAQLKAIGKPILVKWGGAKSNRIRFEENNIPYKETQIDTTRSANIISSDSRYQKPDTIPQVAMPYLLKIWTEKFKK